MAKETGDSAIANFIQKAFDILQNKDYESVIHWMANGKEFAIKQIDEFQDQILPRHFRHRNINSFVRQLNMYGFHKSRKDPSKNIFSHLYFLRGQPQILHLVKRTIKTKEKQEEQAKVVDVPSNISHEKIEEESPKQKRSLRSFGLPHQARTPKIQKPDEVLPTKTQMALNSFACISYKSFGMAIEGSPLKGLIEKSCVMDSNPQLYMKMQSQRSMWHENQNIIDEEDNISIEDEIDRERRVFQNRRSGVSILQTQNLLQDLEK